MKTVTIDERRLHAPEEAHRLMKEQLRFPPYYGGNLAALADCLGDISEPTRIVMVQAPHRKRTKWFAKMARVVRRCAAENPHVTVELMEAGPDGLDGTRKEAFPMDNLKLDLTKDATRQGIRDQLYGHMGAEAAGAIREAVKPLAESEAHFHDVGEVSQAIRGLPVTDSVKDDALGVYAILAQAEAQVHGCAVEDTHFHEVGNAEAVANVVEICLAVQELGRPAITATPVQTGHGKVQCAHGLLDIPAPATAAILGRGIPVCADTVEGEWCTPTSAAIILHFVSAFE